MHVYESALQEMKKIEKKIKEENQKLMTMRQLVKAYKDEMMKPIRVFDES